jgi:hypothetical protein
MTNLISPALHWASKRGLACTVSADSIKIDCPICHGKGTLRVHQQKLFFFCFPDRSQCYVTGAGEKALDALFDAKK